MLESWRTLVRPKISESGPCHTMEQLATVSMLLQIEFEGRAYQY